MAWGPQRRRLLADYHGRHQPRFRKINLPEGGSYRIDIIDTWNMTIDRFADAANGGLRSSCRVKNIWRSELGAIPCGFSRRWQWSK